jgi:inositol transport system substrate-binding protein
MKKLLVVLLVVMLVMAMVVACGQPEAAMEKTDSEAVAETTEEAPKPVEDEKIVIGLTNGNLANEHNAVYGDAAIAYVEENFPNVEFLQVDGAGSVDNQVSQCENFVAQGVDCVIVLPYDAEGSQAAVQVCLDAGVPVFTSKAQIADQTLVPTYVGSNDVSAGQIEMTYIAELIGGEGDIVIVEGPPGISAAILRNEGIYSVLEKYPDINVLYTQPADWNRALAMDTMENWLQLGDDIKAVVAHNDEMALGAYDALVEAGLDDTIPVIGIDAIPAALESVEAGGLSATVLQDAVAIAETTIDVAIKLANGEEVDELYDVPFVLITPDMVADYK